MAPLQRRCLPGVLEDLTFEQAAQLKDEVRRGVQFTVPPGSVNILTRLPGYQDFNPAREVLRMLRCGFGLKDAPRLWNKILRQVLSQLGMTPLQSDPQLFVWQWRNPRTIAVSHHCLVLVVRKVQVMVDDALVVIHHTPRPSGQVVKTSRRERPKDWCSC